MNYAAEAANVFVEHYGTPTPQATYKPRIPVPSKKKIEELKSVTKLGKKRKFSLLVSRHDGKDPNSWMHQYGIWEDNKNIVTTMTLTTTSTLSVKDYGKLMAAALNECDIWIHDIIELQEGN